MGNNITDFCDCNSNERNVDKISNGEKSLIHIEKSVDVSQTYSDKTEALNTTKTNSLFNNPKKENNTSKEIKPEIIPLIKTISDHQKQTQLCSSIEEEEKNFHLHQTRQTKQNTNTQNTQEKKELHFSKNQTIQYPNGDVYTGDFDSNDLRHGKGKLTFFNGDYYEGEFKNDKFNGMGKFIDNITKCEYEGYWEDNLKNGKGKETFKDGSIYEGDYVKGMKHGKGKLILSNHSEYEGEFIRDKIEGKGMFKWNKDKMYFGEWVNNSLNGIGCFLQGNNKYIGHFKNDKKEGLGINYFYQSNNFIIGKWRNDNIEGVAVFVSSQMKQIWDMKGNKMVKMYTKDDEIAKVKQSQEYLEIQNFYSYLRNSEYKDNKMILKERI